MKSFGSRLLDALGKVDRPGNFFACGAAPMMLPGLEVDGVGTIGLPLPASQAEALKEVCEQAGYGKREQTIVDTSVRRVWKLSPDRFALTNPQWPQTVNGIVADVQRELGLEKQELQAHLYDLLLYEKGGFFLPHRDGEKLPRMVATLIIALPSSYTGGELVIRNEGHEQVIDFSGKDGEFKTRYAAFYADCEHEVKPLLSGFRLCLVYNLTLAKSKAPIGAPKSREHVSSIAGILSDWPTHPSGPDKLAITLTHQYTKDGLSWDALKGVDRSRALALAEAARLSGSHAYLGLLTLWESGSIAYDGEYEYGYGRRHSSRREREPGTHVMEEMYDTSLKVEHLQNATGESMPMEFLHVQPEEVFPEKSLKSVDPEEDVQGYTGNEGLTLDRWYRHAVIVLWPDSHHFDVLCDDDARKAVPLLNQMTADVAKLDITASASQLKRCKAFAKTILQRWPEQTVRPWRSDLTSADPNDPTPALVQLQDIGLVRLFLRSALTIDVVLEPAKDFPKAITQHGWKELRPDLIAVFEKASPESIERDTRLFKHLCVAASKLREAKERTDAHETCRQLAELAIAALVRIDAARADNDYRSRPVNRTHLLAELTRGLLAVDLEDLLHRLLRHVTEKSDKYGLHAVQLPALAEVRESLKKPSKTASAALTSWIKSCIDQLEALTAVAPAPPTDYRREALVRCECEHCAELNQFLQDPGSSEHRFQLAERHRKHIQESIHYSKSDLTHKTDKKPRPQVLICTKNTKSYERLVEQYGENLNHLEALGAMLADQSSAPDRRAQT